MREVGGRRGGAQIERGGEREGEREVNCMQTKASAYLRRAEALAASSAACRLRGPGREFFSGPGDPRLPGGSAKL